MTNEKKEKIEQNMDEVIETSKKMRNFLMDEKIPLEEKKNQLKVLRGVLEFNRNIVSASVVDLHLEEFGN